MSNKNINLENYKGALIQYFCEECNNYDSFFEDFANKISRIKSGSCYHFNFKFIANFDGNKFKYSISFNCNNCEESEIKNLFDETTTTNISKINYKCKKCGQGSINFELILSDEIIIDDNEKNDNEKNDNNNLTNSNNFKDDINSDLNNQNLIGNNIQMNNNQNILNINFPNNRFNNSNINNIRMMNNMNNMIYLNNINPNFNIIPNNNMNFVNMMMPNNFNNINNMNNIFFNNNGINNINLRINPINNNISDKIKLLFKEMTGSNSYEVYASPRQVFGEVVRLFLNEHKEIDKKTINRFVSGGNILHLQKTIEENNLENNSQILITSK